MFKIVLTIIIIFLGTNIMIGQEKDKYLWLEDINSKKSLDWVNQHNKITIEQLTKNNYFETLNKRLLGIYNNKDSIPLITKHGDFYYNFWKDDKNIHGIWRRASLEEYKKSNPEWENVLDLDELSKTENENWVWKRAQFLPPKDEIVLLSLSKGGSDAIVIREFDVINKQFIENGFFVPEAKTNVSWKDKDTIFVSTNFGTDSLTNSGYPRITKEWQRGTKLEEAKTIFEGQKDDIGVGVYKDFTEGFEKEIAYRHTTFYTDEEFVKYDNKFIKIDKPDSTEINIDRNKIFLQLRKDWGKYKSGSLLVCDYDKYMAGDRNLYTLFEPSNRISLQSYYITKNYILLNVLDNISSYIYIYNNKYQKVELNISTKYTNITAWPVDNDNSDDCFVYGSSYTSPYCLSYLSWGNKPKVDKLKTQPEFFAGNNILVQQYEAISKDGTKIPYFILYKKDLVFNSKNPTILYGYGGFEYSLTPHYSGTIGSWLENGGVYVNANIRGGGEFGPKWHQAGLKENRHKVYEDFAAVAQDLCNRKITNVQYLGCLGGSNGGLLTGNMLTQYPNLFKAIVCEVPLLDMKRYTKLLAGASWMAEYGDPKKPEEWKFIKTFSPYHNVLKDTKYPKILFITSTKDDRVHPGHARKMVAKMEDMGHNVLLYENTDGGHASASDNKSAALIQSLIFTFFHNELK